MTLEDIKQWVVNKASVTKPYGGDWSVSVTLGMDINETADTLENAYVRLTQRIHNSSHFSKLLNDILNKQK